LLNTRTKETTSVAQVFNCDNCDEDLDNVATSDIEKRTKIDIVFEKQVTHVEGEIKSCPTCHSVTKGKFPADFHGPLQ
jgi:transposase